METQKMIVVDGKLRTTVTPILISVKNQVSLTLSELIINGKKYIIEINENGKAQMK